jgi:hypothetical protein
MLLRCLQRDPIAARLQQAPLHPWVHYVAGTVVWDPLLPFRLPFPASFSAPGCHQLVFAFGCPSVLEPNSWLGLGLGLGLRLQSERLLPFSVGTEFTAPPGKMNEHLRGMPLVSCMQKLKAQHRHGNQWQV